MRDVVVRRDLLGGGERALLYAVNLLPGTGSHGRRQQLLDAEARGRGGSRNRHSRQELAAIEVKVLWCDL